MAAACPAPTMRPGVAESIGRVQDGAQRLVTAHMALLKAELAVTGRDLGIIAGLVVALLALVVLALLLIAIGTFLFLGEWLFGSMAWGILHGTLFLALLVRAHRHRPRGRLVAAPGSGASPRASP